MSRRWVIDASLGLAWIHPHQASAQTDTLLREVGTGITLLVPALWFLEVANALLVLERRRRIKGDERREALATLRALNINADFEGVTSAFVSQVTGPVCEGVEILVAEDVRHGHVFAELNVGGFKPIHCSIGTVVLETQVVAICAGVTANRYWPVNPVVFQSNTALLSAVARSLSAPPRPASQCHW